MYSVSTFLDHRAAHVLYTNIVIGLPQTIHKSGGGPRASKLKPSKIESLSLSLYMALFVSQVGKARKLAPAPPSVSHGSVFVWSGEVVALLVLE